MTPAISLSPKQSPRIRQTDDGATSGDADEENDSQTDSQPDSELSFRTKHSGLRRRAGIDPAKAKSTALELSLGPTGSVSAGGSGSDKDKDKDKDRDKEGKRNTANQSLTDLNSLWLDETSTIPIIPETIHKLYLASSLRSLRLLAIVPSMWGTLVLSQALVLGGLWHDVWPWGADFSSEALYRLSQGGAEYEGDWKRVVRGDILLAIAWVSVVDTGR